MPTGYTAYIKDGDITTGNMNEINEFYENDVARAHKRWQEELKRTADKNMWMKQFLDSLDNI